MRLLLLLTIWPSLLFSQKTSIADASAWVENIEPNFNISTSEGSIQYYLLDYQENVNQEASYTHVSYKFLNEDGVQSYSNISVSYDPSYQKLIFHEVKIIREGEEINKLNLADINTIQRENDMSRNLYDGSLTSYLNLADVRPGDVLEYSFTIKGYNPLLKGEFASSYYQDFSIPVERLYMRIISSAEVHMKTVNGAEALSKAGDEYALDLKPNLIEYESNTPGWYYPYRTVFLSTFESWNEVADWALPLYRLTPSEIKEISELVRNEIEFGDDLDDDILKAIRFVQDDLRYLGFESGIKGYKPTDPSVVLERRFGDCKDKSNLLVSILRSLGVEAYPMLVNSYKKHTIDWEQPSPFAFDHCVVNINYNNQDYYIDPTMNSQGGSLNEIHFPNYQRGLILNSNQNGLALLDSMSMRKQKVEETITIMGLDVESEAVLDVTTIYFGSSADYIRSYFKNNTLSSITREYTTFYSNLYPNITSNENVSIEDENRNGNNEVVVKESYAIENFWSEQEGGGIIGETYALLIESFLSQKAPAKRKMPYYFGGPFEIEEQVRLIMPETWNVSEETVEVSGDGFTYESQSTGDGEIVTVNYKYTADRTYLNASDAKEFLEKRDDIQNDLSFNVTYNPFTESGSDINWWVILLAIITLAVSVYFALKIYREYNPEPDSLGGETQLGGWLILLAIGLSITPLRLIYGFGDLTSYVNLSSWQAMQITYPDHEAALGIIILLEIALNVVFLVSSILIVFLFYTRRSSAPLVITVFLLFNLVFLIVDTLLVGYILADSTVSDSAGEILKSGIYAIIWSVYLNNSSRVKQTFTKTLNNQVDESD